MGECKQAFQIIVREEIGNMMEGRATVNICLFQVNKGNIRKRYEICSKLTIKTPE